MAPRVTAAVLGVAPLVFLALAGAALYGEVNKGDAGYLATAFHCFASDRSATASEDLDVDAGRAGWFVDTDSLRPAAPTGQPDTAKPVSVGIARSYDVDEYLAGTDPARVSELNYLPFNADYDDHPAGRGPASPGDQRFWAATSAWARTFRSATRWPGRRSASGSSRRPPAGSCCSASAPARCRHELRCIDDGAEVWTPDDDFTNYAAIDVVGV